MTITVQIKHDPDPQNPRKEFDNAGVMACWHRRYELGDVQPKCDGPAEWVEENAPEGSVVLPLYLYDHSGITMSCAPFSSAWDSAVVGVIVATPAVIAKEWNGDRLQAMKYLRSEVDQYDHYLTGAVYGYVIERTLDKCECCGSIPEPELVDSCWGFYGYESVLGDMKEHVEDQYHAALEKAWNGGMI